MNNFIDDDDENEFYEKLDFIRTVLSCVTKEEVDTILEILKSHDVHFRKGWLKE